MIIAGALMKLRNYILPLFIFIFNTSLAQRVITGKVTDAQTKQALASCSVYSLHSGNGVITDENGNYTLPITGKIDSIAISMIGYKPLVKKVSGEENQVINFEAEHSSNSLLEVTVSVKSKYTRAQRLVRQVIKNKYKHNIYEKDFFKAQVYDKVEFDAKNFAEKIEKIRVLKPLRFMLDNVDSTADHQKYLPLYLSETMADFYYKRKPENTRYEYTAIKSSGVNNKSILTYIDALYKTINIYDNLIKLVDINFISPIADNALNFYNYHINDTMLIDGHQCIQVQFFQKQYGTNTFNGFMWIVDTTYAIKSMTMHMDKSAAINFVNKFEITQNFELTGQNYLPSKNVVFIDLNLPVMKKMGVIAKKTTLFKNFVFDNSIDTVFDKKVSDISSVKINAADTAYWSANRFEPLSKTERSVYRMMDTIQKIPALITYGKIIDALQSGYYTSGNFDIGNIYSFYYNNRAEGNRFNIGAKTNWHFNKDIQLKGYAGIATKDNQFRYFLGSTFVLNRNQWSTLRFSYSNDIISSYNYEDELDQTSIFAALLRRVKSKDIRLVNDREADIFYNKFFANGFGINLEAKSSALTPYFNIYYRYNKFIPYLTENPAFDSYRTNEVAFTLRYVYKEKYIVQHFRRGSLGSNYPIINLTFTKGLKFNNGLLKSDFDYSKWKLNIQQDFSDGRLGQLSYTLQGGVTNGILPILLLDVQKGNDTYYYNPYAFNSMNRYEFVADKFASFIIEQNFGSFPFNHIPLIKKLKWRSIINFKGVIGGMSEANKVANGFYDSTISYHFTVPDKTPYMETGIGVENIFRVFRLDAVWRLNYLNNPNVPKFGLKASLQFKF